MLRKRLDKTIGFAVILAACSTGAAHATEGWYGRADLGYSTDADLSSIHSSYGGGEDLPDADLNDSAMGSVGLGFAFVNHWRLEGEVSYRGNDIVEDTTWNSGDVKAYALMANLYYDFLKSGWFQPYLGVGVGGAVVKADVVGLGGDETFSDTDTVLAYQALAGVAFPLASNLDLDIGYRYFVAPNLSFDGVAYGGGRFPISEDLDYTHQAVTLGLRWQFAAPAAPPPPPAPPAPPPPPPPVATCPQSDFVVYFEWDRSNLNQSALEVIDSAVARARECNISGVTLVGHTDTSGTPQYNVALSERRASVVRDALVARGLTASLINTQAVGETDLARPTADGVREPLNRRTAVTISFQ